MRYHPYSVFQNTQDLRIQAFQHSVPELARDTTLRSMRTSIVRLPSLRAARKVRFAELYHDIYLSQARVSDINNNTSCSCMLLCHAGVPGCEMATAAFGLRISRLINQSHLQRP